MLRVNWLIDEEELTSLVSQGLSSNKIAVKLYCSRSTVRYWATKHDVQLPGQIRNIEPRSCVICGREIPATNGGRKCSSCYTKIRRLRIKIAAVAYLGGECEECRWEGEVEGFDFHHPDANKEFSIANAYCRSLKAIKAELDKCTLLCSRCHRIEHVIGPTEALWRAVLETPIEFNKVP